MAHQGKLQSSFQSDNKVTLGQDHKDLVVKDQLYHVEVSFETLFTDVLIAAASDFVWFFFSYQHLWIWTMCLILRKRCKHTLVEDSSRLFCILVTSFLTRSGKGHPPTMASLDSSNLFFHWSISMAVSLSWRHHRLRSAISIWRNFGKWSLFLNLRITAANQTGF